MIKPHGNTGKKNALKADAAKSMLKVRVTDGMKIAWYEQAKIERITLSKWVIKSLQEKVKDKK